jgi:hypothetical protein
MQGPALPAVEKAAARQPAMAWWLKHALPCLSKLGQETLGVTGGSEGQRVLGASSD